MLTSDLPISHSSEQLATAELTSQAVQLAMPHKTLTAMAKTTASATKPLSLGIVCAAGLGDAIIQMVLANNLARNGYQVTFYSDMASQLHSHIAGYQVLPFPRESNHGLNDFAKQAVDQLTERVTRSSNRSPDQAPSSAIANNAVIQQLQQHHIVLYDCLSQYHAQASAELRQWLQAYAIAYQASNGTPIPVQFAIEQHLREQLPNVSEAKLKQYNVQLQALNSSLKTKSLNITRSLLTARPPIVRQITQCLRQDVGLHKVTNETGLQLRRHQFNPRKILLHPSSSHTKKNWSAQSYIELAKRLQVIGYQPVITVSPTERQAWLQRIEHYEQQYRREHVQIEPHLVKQLVKPPIVQSLTEKVAHRFAQGVNQIMTPEPMLSPNQHARSRHLSQSPLEVPHFVDIEQLALFYQDAAWFIGNDSGNAHLASALGVPTLQIFGRWRRFPAWRAGWSTGQVITANFPRNLSKDDWQTGVSVDRVYNKFVRWVSES